MTNSNYPVVLPDTVRPVELPEFSGHAYTIVQLSPNTRVTRGANTRVTRGGNVRVTRGYYPYTLNAQLVAVELPSTVAPLEVE